MLFVGEADPACRLNALRLIQSLLYDEQSSSVSIIHEALEVVSSDIVQFKQFHSNNKSSQKQRNLQIYASFLSSTMCRKGMTQLFTCGRLYVPAFRFGTSRLSLLIAIASFINLLNFFLIHSSAVTLALIPFNYMIFFKNLRT